jgi:quercetin dioxygenase-like cupin family protein
MDTDAFDLKAEAERLFNEGAWNASGRLSKMLLKRADLRLVLFAMRANALLDEHKTPAAITVQPISGRVQMKLRGRTVNLAPEQMVVVDSNIPHDVRALEDSAFLLTMVFPEVAAKK